MSKNQEVLPFTEIVERVREIARIASPNDISRARGAVNDVYVRKLPSEEDWNFFLASSAITADPQYNTGTVSVNTQSATVTFGGGAVLDSSMTAWRMKFNQNNDIYTFTFSNTTGGTINPVLSGDQNITNGAFTLFHPIYALAANFDRFPRKGGLLYFSGGRDRVIPERGTQNYFRDYIPFPGQPSFCRLVETSTDGLPHVEIVPPPLKAYNFPYEYLIRPTTLRENTAGVVNIAAGGTAVTGSAGVSQFTAAQTGWYLRIDAFGTGADSEWYRVSAITHDSALTLQTAFGLSGAVSAGFTLCSVPAMPAKLHPAVLYGAITVITADQNDPLFQFYDGKYRETIDDGKRLYKSRLYDQEVELVFEEYHYRR